MELITNPNMMWLPIAVFITIIIIASLIGVWNGWKTSLYFLVWNILSLIIVVSTMYFWYQDIWDFVANKLLPTKDNEKIFDTSTILNVSRKHLKSVFGILILLITFFFINLFAFSIYWIFRKNLKKSIFENKQKGLSNKATRIVGASIGVVSSLPVGIALVQSATFLSPESKFTNFYDTLSSNITINQISDFKNNRESMRAILLSTKNGSQIETLIKLITSSEDNPFKGRDAKFINKHAHELKTIINSNIMKDIAKITFQKIKEQIKDPKDQEFDYKKLEKKIPSNMQPIEITKNTESVLKKLIKSTFQNETNKVKIAKFIEGIFRSGSKLFKVK